MLYPRAFVEPKNGKIFVAGSASPSLYLNPFGTGGWSGGPARLVAERTYAAAVMLDNKVIYFGGGGENNCPSNLPTATAEMIDLGAATPAWKAIAPMTLGRRQLNATILADGTVLVTGGTSQCGYTNEAGAVFAAERWNPSGGSNGEGAWTTLANAGVVRVYHSTASLMADGQFSLREAATAAASSPRTAIRSTRRPTFSRAIGRATASSRTRFITVRRSSSLPPTPR